MTPQYAKDQPQGYNNYITNVAIVGAGGRSGKHMVEYLVKNGKHNVTALTRGESTNIMPSGVSIKTIDYSNPATITTALQGQDCFIITLPAQAPPGQHDLLVKAAADAKVPWVIPNEYGYAVNEQVGKDVILGIANQKNRAYIESLEGVSWIGIACGFWYEFSLGGSILRYGFDIPGRQVLWFDNGEQKINTSTFPQVGRAVASLLALKVLPDDEHDKSPCLNQYRNRFVQVSSFTVNQRDMFESLLRVTGTQKTDWKFSSKPSKEIYEEGKAKMQSGDLLGFVQLLYSRVFFLDDHPGLMEASALDNDKLNLPKEDLDEFTSIAVEMAESG